MNKKRTCTEFSENNDTISNELSNIRKIRTLIDFGNINFALIQRILTN